MSVVTTNKNVNCNNKNNGSKLFDLFNRFFCWLNGILNIYYLFQSIQGRTRKARTYNEKQSELGWIEGTSEFIIEDLATVLSNRATMK